MPPPTIPSARCQSSTLDQDVRFRVHRPTFFGLQNLGVSGCSFFSWLPCCDAPRIRFRIATAGFFDSGLSVAIERGFEGLRSGFCRADRILLSYDRPEQRVDPGFPHQDLVQYLCKSWHWDTAPKIEIFLMRCCMTSLVAKKCTSISPASIKHCPVVTHRRPPSFSLPAPLSFAVHPA